MTEDEFRLRIESLERQVKLLMKQYNNTVKRDLAARRQVAFLDKLEAEFSDPNQ
jgi:hypothetical protein